MAKRRRARKGSLKGTPRGSRKTFDPKRISMQKATHEVVLPIIIGLAGAAIGNGLPKGKNLIGAGVVGMAALALNETRLIPAAIGMAAVIPSVQPLAGLDGIEGIGDHVKLVGTGAKAYLKGVLSNAGAEKIAAKLEGFEGWDGIDGYDDYDLEGLEEYSDEPYLLNGIGSITHNGIATSSSRAMTPEAMILNGRG